MDADEVVHFLTGEPIAKVSRANAGLIQRDMRKAANARDALRKIPDRRTDCAHEGRRRSLHERRAAARRRHPDTGRFREAAVGEHRASRGAVPREHEEEPVRAERDGQHPQVADARAGSERVDERVRRRERRADQLSGAEPGARARAAVELARRAHVVAADHPDADRPRAEARPAGAVDAVSRGRGVFPGRHSARGDFDLSRARRKSARRSSAPAAAA